jgi:hypothetical protein
MYFSESMVFTIMSRTYASRIRKHAFNALVQKESHFGDHIPLRVEPTIVPVNIGS